MGTSRDLYAESELYGELERDASDPPMGDAASEAPFRFEGVYYDSGVKTYDMQARSYRPDIGRFLSADRYQDAQADLELQSDPLTQNRYAFAGGNPVGNVEFDGHRSFAEYIRGLFPKHSKQRNQGLRSAKQRTRESNAQRRLQRSVRAGLSREQRALYDLEQAAGIRIHQVARMPAANQRMPLLVPDPGEAPFDRLFGRDYVTPEQAGAMVLEGGGGGTIVRALGIGAGKSGPARTRLGPGGGLAAHEGPSAGQTLARHVDVDDAILRQRLSATPSLQKASRFTSREVAEEAVSGVIALNRPQLRAFLASNKEALKLGASFNQSVGRTVFRDGTARAVRRATVIIRKAPDRRLGYRIHTSFPDPP